MKKLLRLGGLTAGIVLAIACTTTAEAAVVDKTAPYEGEYFIAYNKQMEYYSDYPESVPLPAMELGEEENPTDNHADYSVIDVHTNENGETIYRVEFRNLDNLTPPLSRSSLAFTASRQNAMPQVGDEREFITESPALGTTEHTLFVLKYSGEHCNIWLEKNDTWGITDEMVTELGMEYDVKIHDKMRNAFGAVYDRDGDEKVAFLLYDIQDGFGEYTNAYTGGFFSPSDLMYDDYNCMDVLHIDTYPTIIKWDGTQTLSEAKSTMVHELQHLIEGSYCAKNDWHDLPLWIDEGFSMAAEHMLYGVRKNRIQYYNEEAKIGTPLIKWADDVAGAESLSNYAYSYLFFQYLRILSKDFPGGGETIFRAIIENKYRNSMNWAQGGARTIEELMRQFYPNISIEEIIRNFYIALTLNEPTGIYGFGGEPGFDEIKPKLYDGDESSPLNGGAAVIKKMDIESYAPQEETFGDIRYAAFTSGRSSVDAPKASETSGQIYQFKSVTLSCAEQYATMYYTLDGSEPDEHSLIYTGDPIQFLSGAILKAITITPDGRKSEVVEYAYTIKPEDVELYRRLIDCRAFGVIQSPDGGFIQIGEYYSRTPGDEELCGLFYDSSTAYSVFLIKYDQDGSIRWLRPFGREYEAMAYDMIALEDGFAIVGHSNRREKEHSGDFEGLPIEDNELIQLDWRGTEYAYIAKFDWNGNKQWINGYPLSHDAKLENAYAGYHWGVNFNALVASPDDGVIAAGIAECSSQPYYHQVLGDWLHSGSGAEIRDVGSPIIIKANAQGDLLWRKKLALPDGCGSFFDVAVLDDETIVAAGYASQKALGKGDLSGCPSQSSDPTNHDIVPILVAFDQNGNILWEKAFEEYLDKDTGYFSYLLSVEDGFVVSGCERILRFWADSSGCTFGWETACPGIKIPHLAPAEDGLMVAGQLDFRTYYYNIYDLYGLLPVTNISDTLVLKLDLDSGDIYWTRNVASKFFTNMSYVLAYDFTSLGNRKYAVTGSVTQRPNSSDLDNHAFLVAFYDESTPYYKVSGNVGLPGVSIGGKLSDSQGNYTVKVMEGESVTLTPSLPGYTFSEPSRNIGPVTEPVTGVDFTPNEIRYTLRGRILDADGSPLAGVTVARDVVTGADGYYFLMVRPGSTVLLEPQLEGKSFEPSVITRSRVDEDEDNLDFRILKPRYTISGKVTREGKGQGGVEVFKGILTEPDGTYSFTTEEGSVLTLTPRFNGYSFEPSSRDIPAVEADLTGQDFFMKSTTDPDKPDPDEPDPDNPNPDKPDPDEPDPDKPDPDKPDPDKPDPDKPEPEEPDDPKPSTPSTGGGSGGGHSVAPPKGETPAQATHTAYLQGYPDGCFHPDDTLTRAQCAAMLSRLDPAFDPERVTVSLPFSDTGAKRWFAPYLSFCHQRRLVRGYPDGTFRPDRAMTRGEFASVVRNALALESAGEEFFPDTETHWARYPIAQLVQAGILDGYPDGTFRPDEPISRAEAAKVLNRVWQRPGTEEHLAEVPAPEYPDLSQSHWAYREIWEASVSHPAEKK